MAGPVQGKTKTRIFGHGFKPLKTNVDLKWGVLATQVIERSLVEDYVYTQNGFYAENDGVKAYWLEAVNFGRKDDQI